MTPAALFSIAAPIPLHGTKEWVSQIVTRELFNTIDEFGNDQGAAEACLYGPDMVATETRYPDGTRWIEINGISQPDWVWENIFQAFGLKAGG